MLSCAQAASCQMERLNARVYNSKHSWLDICKEKGGCEEREDEKGRWDYVKTFRTAPIYFASICAALQKDMNNSKLQKEFFLYFPSNFYMFNSFFGLEVVGTETLDDGKEIYAPLYYYKSDENSCVELFFKLNTIQKECVYEKAINIVQDAFLRDDVPITEIQVNLYIAISEDLNRFISVLSKRSEKEQRDFWYLQFRLYDVPPKLPEGLEKIKTINKRSYDIMIDELKKAQADDVH
jgi:hypothetical protein